jgi:D-alanyl-D-alanine carboxypeptidase (penicillin-binding protein 5/6)
VVLFLALAGLSYARPLPSLVASQIYPAAVTWGGSAPALPWPAQGEAAIGVQGQGVEAATANVTPQPMASLAKVMTALVVLHDKPLTIGAQGPSLTISSGDVQTYLDEQSQGDYVVPLQAGEQLSEYQLLQALLIPAGDNIADLLADWVSGSETAFVAEMNAEAKRLDLVSTHFADASGISSSSVSIPADMVAMGEAAMANPVLAGIVGQPSMLMPDIGTLPNFDTAIGQDGIVGIKTGILPGSGAAFLFAGSEPVQGGAPALVIGAVLGMPDQNSAFGAAESLLAASGSQPRWDPIVSRGQVVATLRTAWGTTSELVASRSLSLLIWPDTVVRAHLLPRHIEAPVAAGAPGGKLVIAVNGHSYALPVSTVQGSKEPTARWRLLHVR